MSVDAGARTGTRGQRRRYLVRRLERTAKTALRRWGISPQVVVCAGLVVLSLLMITATTTWSGWWPPSMLVLIVLLGGYALRLPGAIVLSAVVGLELAALSYFEAALVRPGVVVAYVAVTIAVLAFVRSRDKLGLQGVPGDLMIVDLRDRLEAHGRIPPLPDGWRVDSVLRSANGEAFSGDFVVASRGEGGRLLELVLVDVSGKGQEAGVRSLLLSGAFGGLLGAMGRREFLPAANAYLLEQEWDEGFATAVHLALRLDTGEYWIATAGHPPAVHLHAGSGRVELIDTIGAPALGLMDAPRYTPHRGQLESGDTLILYTDGIVETPGADVELGIDRLMGVVERIVATRSGDAEAVLDAMRSGPGDDRALVLVHRE